MTPESILSQEDFKSQHLWDSRHTSPAVMNCSRSCSLAAWGSSHLETAPKAAEQSTLWVTRSTVLAGRLAGLEGFGYVPAATSPAGDSLLTPAPGQEGSFFTQGKGTNGFR